MQNFHFYQETERLILRSPLAEDAALLAAQRSTDFVTRYNLYRPCDAAQIQGELEAYQHIILVLKEENRVFGCVSIREDYLRHRVDARSLQAWLPEEMAYQGYMAEAVDAILAYLLLEGVCERVSVQIFADNRASIRLAEKLGFEREGYLKRAVKNHLGQVFDVVLFSMDEETYRKKKTQ